jgi:aminoacrylate hydrolase
MPHAAGLYYEWHGPEDGEVLILSSGLGGSAHYWTPNLAALAKRYRVLLYDHRGTGRSSPIPPGPTSVEAMAKDVQALIDALGVKEPHFLGHALGGLIGLELSLHVILGKLVIVNAWGELDPHTARCFDIRVDVLRKSGRAAYLRAQPLFLYPAAWISDHLQDLDAEAERQLEQLPPADTIERRIDAARSYCGLFDCIAFPGLLIAAADDMLVPARCSQWLATLMNAEPPLVETMAWGGHACNVTDPETFNRLVVTFLGS